MPGRRVLITGRYGFTGRYVADVLTAQGWDVWGLSGSRSEEADPQHLQANLTDKDGLARVIAEIAPDAVIHLAALAFVAHDTPEQFYNVNTIGTRNLLQVLSDGGHGQAGVILSSSANIYGLVETTAIREDTPPHPANDYAVSKLASEYVARLFLDRLPIVIARPFNYTGRGQSKQFLVPKIVAHFRARADEIQLGNLDVARDFSDVRDVARAYGALLGNAAPGEVVNICSGHATSLSDILHHCEDLTGHSMRVTVNPDFVRRNEIKSLKGDPTHLERWISAQSRIDLRDTLKWMLTAP